MKRLFCLCSMVLMVLFMFPLTTTGVTIEVLTPGTLEQVVDNSDEPSFKDLKIVGQMNAVDIKYLRNGSGRIATVENLDLSDAVIVSSSEAYATVSYSDNSNTMDNYVITFYASEENRKEVSSSSNMLGGNNFTINYYSNQLAGAFANKTYKKVVMPKNVQEVGPMTFFQCKDLTSVEFSSPVEVIEERAFESCVSLMDIDLSKVKTLGKSAFAGCESLRGNEEQTIDLSSIEYIPDNAFGDTYYNSKWCYCTAFKHVVFSRLLKRIGARAFYNCESLVEVNLPEGLEEIGIYAFYGCKSLATVNIPSSVQKFDYDMFGNTPWLSTLPAEDGVIYLNNIAVRCMNNEWADFSITIRDGTESIAPNFMAEDSKRFLTSVVLPQTIKRIGGGAFNGCYNLTSINFPEGLESIEDESPHQWGNEVYTSDEGAFQNTGITSVVLPSTLKTIGRNTFSGCESLASITLPDGLEEIRSAAFTGCEKLTSVTLPESVKKIGSCAFYDCTSLVGSVTIPKGVTELGPDIFYNTNLFSIVYLAENAVLDQEYNNSGILSAERVTIGSQVQSLPNGFLANCKTLKKVIFEERAENAELVLGDCCFSNCEKLTSIDLPKTIKVGKGCFSYTPLTTIVFKDGLQEVGEEAFSCTQLTTVDLGSSVTSIGKGAFSGLAELTSINWGNNLKYLGDQAFAGDKKLETVNLPEGLEYLGWRCFEESGITGIHVPGSVGNIKSYTFQSCTNLVDVELGEGIETIGDHAFAFCSSLESIVLPEGLKTLETDPVYGGYIFRDCTSLKQVSLPSTLQDLGSWHFPSTLETIISYMKSPIDIIESSFDYWNYKNTRLIVPSGSKAAYLSKNYWKDFENIEEMASTTDMLIVNDVNIEQGKTATINIFLQSEVTDYTAYQFDLVLPQGVQLATYTYGETYGEYIIEKGNRYTGSDHTITIEKLSSNDTATKYRIACLSMSNAEISVSSTPLLSLALYAEHSLTEGDYTASLSNITFSQVNEAKSTLGYYDFSINVTNSPVVNGDVNNDGSIDVSDAVAVVNCILNDMTDYETLETYDVNGDGVVDVFDVTKVINIILSDHSYAAERRGMINETSLENAHLSSNGNNVWMDIDHAERFTAFQFNVEVPEGLTLTAARLATTTSHQPQIAKVGQNLYTVVGLSMNSESLPMTNGKLIELQLSGNAEGDVRLSKVMFVTPTGQAVHFNGDVLGAITGIGNVKGMTDDNVIYDLSGRKLNKEHSELGCGVYIINNKKVIIK